MITVQPTTQKYIPQIMALERRKDIEKYVFRNTESEHLAYIRSNDVAHLTFLNAENEFIGFAFIRGLLSPHHELELKRIAITQPGFGFGRQVLQQIIKLSFETLKTNRLWLDVFTFNPRALHVYQSLGFKEEGIKRECVLVDGKYEDLILMSMLKSEYVRS